MLRVQVHAVILVDGKVVVHRSIRHGHERLSLPGGRVKLRESLPDALRRKVREDVNVEIEVGDLLFGAEVFDRLSLQDVILVFDAAIVDAGTQDQLDLIDPASDEAARVIPPVLQEFIGGGPHRQPRWLGNVHLAGLSR